jgi:SAM-dependent methyltransferase
MSLDRYFALKRWIAPGLRFNQDLYEDALRSLVSRDTVWLEAGCGWHVLPEWRAEQERELVERARLVVGCDMDLPSLAKHRTIARCVLADLAFLPFRTGSLTLLSSNMVVEHLDDPTRVFREFARVLKDGGHVLIHTPNVRSHFVLLSRFLPRRLKLPLIRRLEDRPAEDVFPTRYRANTPRALRAVMADSGLELERLRMVASEATTAQAHPVLAALELLYIRLTLTSRLRWLRVTMLATFVKRARP